MIISVDYPYYRDNFAGTLTENDFNVAYSYASDTISSMLSSEPTEITSSLQNALCHLIDLVHDDQTDSGLTGERLGDYSYTVDRATKDAKSANKMQLIVTMLVRAGVYSRRVCTRY